MSLPLERFWSLGKYGRKRSYFNTRERKWEDEVVVENGISKYLLLGNVIASFDGYVLSLHTQGYDTQTTYWRLRDIIDYGKSLGYKIPVLPLMRKIGDKVVKIYWAWEGHWTDFIPVEYPIRIDVHTGEVLTEMLKVISTWDVLPSRSKRSEAVIKRRDGSYYVIKNGKQYLVLDGVIYRLDEEHGLWVEDKDYETRKLIESMESML